MVLNSFRPTDSHPRSLKYPTLNMPVVASLTGQDIIASIAKEGFNLSRATAVFRESATTQCVECDCELCISSDVTQVDGADNDGPGPSSNRRGRRTKGTTSRGSTRASSPNTPRPVLTRCQHLFCLECYRHSICPGWPNVALPPISDVHAQHVKLLFLPLMLLRSNRI